MPAPAGASTRVPPGRFLLLPVLFLLLAGCRTDPIAQAAATCVQGYGKVAEPPKPVTSAPAPSRVRRPPSSFSRGRTPRYAPKGEIYAGGSILAGPGFGGGAEYGQVFARSALATWSFEGAAAWADLGVPVFGEDGDAGGNWAQVRGGVKASFAPCRRGHPTARAGLIWFRATEDAKFLRGAGDYFGGYLSVGYEWDVTRWLTTGPEVSMIIASQEKRADLVTVPQIQWHFLIRL